MRRQGVSEIREGKQSAEDVSAETSFRTAASLNLAVTAAVMTGTSDVP
jgi:hypothetical protein